MDYAAKRGAMGETPLQKVRDMMDQMIATLEQEAAEEAKHQAFCDREMKHTGEKRDDRQEEVDELTTKIDQAKATVAANVELVKTLRKELAEIAEEQLEMDKVRKEEKESNEKEIKIDKDGVDAMKMALDVLRQFYNQIGSSSASASGRGNGAVMLLEYVQADMHKRVTTLVAAEREAEDEYRKLTGDNKLSTATKSQEVEFKTHETTELEKTINEMTGDRASAQEELDALEEYWAKLTDQCVVKEIPYEVRKEKREKEITGLKEALGHLEQAGDMNSELQVQASSAPQVNTVFLQLRGSQSHRIPPRIKA